MSYLIPKEYGNLDEKVPKEWIGQIKEIAELQNMSFSEAVKMCIHTGITFHQNGYSLQNRALKVQTLDNKLVQIYPFLNKTCTNLGANCTIFDKILHFYVDLSPVLYKGIYTLVKPLNKNLKEEIETQAYDIFKYVKHNFPEEFGEIESYILKNSRNKPVKRLFKGFSRTVEKLPEDSSITLDDTSNKERVEREIEKPDKNKELEKYLENKPRRNNDPAFGGK